MNREMRTECCSVMGLRIDEDEEAEGLDVALHDERGYNLSS